MSFYANSGLLFICILRKETSVVERDANFNILCSPLRNMSGIEGAVDDADLLAAVLQLFWKFLL